MTFRATKFGWGFHLTYSPLSLCAYGVALFLIARWMLLLGTGSGTPVMHQMSLCLGWLGFTLLATLIEACRPAGWWRVAARWLFAGLAPLVFMVFFFVAVDLLNGWVIRLGMAVNVESTRTSQGQESPRLQHNS